MVNGNYVIVDHNENGVIRGNSEIFIPFLSSTIINFFQKPYEIVWYFCLQLFDGFPAEKAENCQQNLEKIVNGTIIVNRSPNLSQNSITKMKISKS